MDEPSYPLFEELPAQIPCKQQEGLEDSCLRAVRSFHYTILLVQNRRQWRRATEGTKRAQHHGACWLTGGDGAAAGARARGWAAAHRAYCRGLAWAVSVPEGSLRCPGGAGMWVDTGGGLGGAHAGSVAPTPAHAQAAPAHGSCRRPPASARRMPTARVWTCTPPWSGSGPSASAWTRSSRWASSALCPWE